MLKAFKFRWIGDMPNFYDIEYGENNMGQGEVPAHEIDYKIWDHVIREIDVARNKWPKFTNIHHALRVLVEEELELVQAINEEASEIDIYQEAIQVAAMALCLCDETITPINRKVKNEPINKDGVSRKADLVKRKNIPA